MKRSHVRGVFNIIGLGALAVSAGMLHVIAGVAAAGVACLIIAFVLDE